MSVEQLELQKEHVKKLITKKNVAQRLANNKDFKELILEDFCTSECANYTHASADPSLPLEARADALNLAQAAGHLKRFLSATVNQGTVAENSLEDLDNAIDEARAEDI